MRKSSYAIAACAGVGLGRVAIRRCWIGVEWMTAAVQHLSDQLIPLRIVARRLEIIGMRAGTCQARSQQTCKSILRGHHLESSPDTGISNLHACVGWRDPLQMATAVTAAQASLDFSPCHQYHSSSSIVSLASRYAASSGRVGPFARLNCGK